MSISNTVSQIQAASASLAENIHRAADIVSGIGKDPLTAAVERLRAECQAARVRMEMARSNVADALEGLLADLLAGAEDMNPVAPLAQAELPFPANAPGIASVTSALEGEGSGIAEQTDAVDDATANADGEPEKAKERKRRGGRKSSAERVDTAACGPVFDQEDEDGDEGGDGDDGPGKGNKKPARRRKVRDDEPHETAQVEKGGDQRKGAKRRPERMPERSGRGRRR